MGYVQYCYVFVSDGMADDVLFVVIVAVKAFMAQLLSPRQIYLNGTIKYIVSYRIISYHIVSYRVTATCQTKDLFTVFDVCCIYNFWLKVKTCRMLKGHIMQISRFRIVFCVTIRIGLHDLMLKNHISFRCSTELPLCLKCSVLAPVSLRPLFWSPVCSDWSAHIRLTQHR